MDITLVFAVEAVPGGWFSPEAATAWFDPQVEEAVPVPVPPAVGTLSGSIGINTAINISL